MNVRVSKPRMLPLTRTSRAKPSLRSVPETSMSPKFWLASENIFVAGLKSSTVLTVDPPASRPEITKS
jgi:hypothetical protein